MLKMLRKICLFSMSLVITHIDQSNDSSLPVLDHLQPGSEKLATFLLT
jgi:hypothetical protein